MVALGAGKSCILLRHTETSNWHYSCRQTSVNETLKDLKENPLKLGSMFTYHGVFESWLSAESVAKEIHDKQILSEVKATSPNAELNEEYNYLYD